MENQKMLISTHTSPLKRFFDDKGAIELIAGAGFEAFDMSYTDMFSSPDDCEINKPTYIKYSEELRRYADSVGIVCNQAHAPFHSSCGDPEEDKKKFDAIVRSMESAAVLGAKNIVVHPKQHLRYSENKEILREMNIEFYLSLVPYCREFGIHVAAENMWQTSRVGGKIVESTCASPDEFRDYIDSVGSEYIVACLDVGHSVLIDRKPSEMIKALGKDRLKALHIHDVDGNRDLHTLPFLANVDFDDVTKALGEIGYEGDITFEATEFPKRMPKELFADAYKFEYAVGRYLASEVEKYRK